MENRIRRILLDRIIIGALSVALFLPGLTRAAEVLKPQESPVIQPEVKRAEFQESKIDTEDFEMGFYAG